MLLNDIIRELELEVFCGSSRLEVDIRRGFASDLMSDVIANAEAGDIWVTLQVHLNTVAIASMKDLGAILLTQDRKPLPETTAKAEKEEIPILGSPLSAFELIGRLYHLGISGC